jgi:hypothetical protein
MAGCLPLCLQPVPGLPQNPLAKLSPEAEEERCPEGAGSFDQRDSLVSLPAQPNAAGSDRPLMAGL